jgi:hypothetical protein
MARGFVLTRAMPVFNSFKLCGLTMFVFCMISFLVNMLFITRRLLLVDCTLMRLICIYTEYFSVRIVDMSGRSQRQPTNVQDRAKELRNYLTKLGISSHTVNAQIQSFKTHYSKAPNKNALLQKFKTNANAANAQAKKAAANAQAKKAAANAQAKKAAVNSKRVAPSTSANNRRCDVDGSKMYYKINDIANVTVNKKGGMEAKFLIDTLKAIRGQCFTVHQQCKGLYPVVSGKEQGRQWLTSIDQDNDISLQHTLDKSEIPILYNTPRFCDPGMTKSKNWSLKNYIQTRLFMYNNMFKNGKKIKSRNSSLCFNSVVFDFRPFVFSMEYNGKKIYITQWMELNPNSEYGYTPNTTISDGPLNKSMNSREFFKQMVLNYSKKVVKSGATVFNNTYPLKIENTNDLDRFLKFINDYDGVGFAGNTNSNGNLPASKISRIPNIKIEDDILRMFYFDLIHDIAKKSPSFRKTTPAMFSLNFTNEFMSLKGGHTINLWAGAGTAATSYEKYGTTLAKKTKNGTTINGVTEVPAIFKTIGDLSQYIYAAKYNTTVASGDRMGIAVGLYVCAKMGVPVKCMIEDGITGFVLYTGRDRIQFTQKSSCKGGNTNGGGACLRNTNTSINGGTIENRVRQFSPNVARQMDVIEQQKPKLPPNMKSLTALWSGAANVLNVGGIDDIVRIVSDFQGYWSNTDLSKLIQIINTIMNRSNVNIYRKTQLSELKGKLRAYLNNKTKSR